MAIKRDGIGILLGGNLDRPQPNKTENVICSLKFDYCFVFDLVKCSISCFVLWRSPVERAITMYIPTH